MVENTTDGFVEMFKTVVYALLIALGVRTFAYEPFNIPSGSMIPTLLVGDYLFVSKFSYGYSRYSFPFGIVPFEGRIMESMPERGDVAVFRFPADTSVDYIKRIVGLPGDRIQVIQGVLNINGEPVERELIEGYEINAGTAASATVLQYMETLPNGRAHPVIETRGDIGTLDNTPLYVVPEGHFFAMGDNRDGSSDSRVMASVGFVPIENLIGRAEILFWSIDSDAWELSFSGFWKLPFAIRYGRLLNGID